MAYIIWNSWNCEVLLCSVEFVLLEENFENMRHLHNFQNNSIFAKLNPLGFGILGMWIVKYCFVLWNLYCLKRLVNPKQFKNFEFMFEFACFYNVCLCHLL